MKMYKDHKEARFSLGRFTLFRMCLFDPPVFSFSRRLLLWRRSSDPKVPALLLSLHAVCVFCLCACLEGVCVCVCVWECVRDIRTACEECAQHWAAGLPACVVGSLNVPGLVCRCVCVVRPWFPQSASENVCFQWLCVCECVCIWPAVPALFDAPCICRIMCEGLRWVSCLFKKGLEEEVWL